MPREKSFTWNGITYASQKVAAEALGVTQGVISYYRRNGYTCDDDLAHSAKPRPVTWNGIDYPTLTDAAKAIGITPQLMWNRIEAGFTCDEEVAYAVRYRAAKPCTWNGIEYNSILEASEANDIVYQTFVAWIDKGFTCDADAKEHNKLNRTCVWNGIEYDSLSDAARACNPPITREAMRLRINKGYTCDADVEHGNSSKGVSIPCTWNDIEYASMTIAAKANGITLEAMVYRLNQGYTCDADMKYNIESKNSEK